MKDNDLWKSGERNRTFRNRVLSTRYRQTWASLDKLLVDSGTLYCFYNTEKKCLQNLVNHSIRNTKNVILLIITNHSQSACTGTSNASVLGQKGSLLYHPHCIVKPLCRHGVDICTQSPQQLKIKLLINT